MIVACFSVKPGYEIELKLYACIFFFEKSAKVKHEENKKGLSQQK